MGTEDSGNFPRGGTRISNTSAGYKRKHEDTLFAAEKPSKPKKQRKEKQPPQKSVEGEAWQSALKLQGTLTYSKMQTGMIILGCIRRISNLALQIELPGLTFALVTVNKISDTFTSKLAKQLSEGDNEESCIAVKNMFTLGQLIPVKILTIDNTDKGYEVHASINPKDINGDRMHISFLKGTTIWASVESELDHGYELSVGVKNCRVFLPYKNIDESKKYAVGETLFCVIHKAESSSNATTLTVSAKQDHIDKIQLNADNLNLHNIIPGTKVELLVEEISPLGIKGHFSENCFGYIDETQIFSKINMDKIREGSSLSAYVLYVEPITKVTYLTLRGLQLLPSPKYEVGKVLLAQVHSPTSRGLYLKLGKDIIGFITNKRLLNTLPKDAELDITKAIQKKYPVGSRHSCRILDYNHMQELYICTFEQNIIKEKVFNLKDLTIGQTVPVKVDKVVPKGLVVKVGLTQGFVPNLHLSNAKYSDSIKGKYCEGMTVNARVLNITSEDNVIFTLKQGLLDAENCLADIKDAVPNSQHVGFVAQTKGSGALIAFSGNVKGWISNRVLNSGNSGQYVDPRNYFFIGQVVTVWILGFKNEKLQVSLHLPNKNKNKKIKVGANSTGTVLAVHKNGVDVEVGNHKIEATIPLAHLSNNLLLCPLLLKSYKVGQEISDIMCLKNTDIPVMSRREYLFYERNKSKIPKLRDLKKGMLLRCSFEKKSDSGILVYTPIVDYHENIEILKENLFSGGKSSSYEKHQCILAKIVNIEYNTRSITLDARINDDDNTTNEVLNLLGQDIEDIEQVINFGRENNWTLTQYKIGERVECKIEKIDDEANCLVRLPNGVNGLIASHLCSSNIKTGTTVKGVVLDYNFTDNCIDICCKKDVMQKINPIQDGFIKKPLHSSSMAEILLVTKFYELGILKDGQCNRQLIYLPLHLSGNGNMKTAHKKNKFKIFIYRKAANRLIAIPKKLVPTLIKKGESTKKKANKINKATQENLTNENVDDDEEDIQAEDTNEHICEEIVENAENSSDEEEPTHENDSSPSCSEESINEPDSHKKESTHSSLLNSTKVESSGAILSGINSFYSSDNSDNLKEDESSSDEETQNQEHNKKKKKLTPTERAELAKKEEERISKIEKELADSTVTPQSAEQFDRLLLANPNSSELWLKYMAMHIATTELEKARTVGKRAIETINMTLVKEKFNIWMALLNLENMYGSKESFEKIFEDATKYNDSLEVYLSVIKLLATSGKLNEMEEKIKKVKAKEKQNTKMWLEIGQVYYSLGKFREARNIKEAALRSILDKKRQFDLIVRFGIMEFQLGDLEQAIANFETILDTYPAKINIWIIYVDQLVKKKKIDSARKVLERAISQKFAVKSMKAIFQKFVDFEEHHGSPESVEEVKQRAKEYVKRVGVK